LVFCTKKNLATLITNELRFRKISEFTFEIIGGFSTNLFNETQESKHREGEKRKSSPIWLQAGLPDLS
jgi:hypothetical protein